jgi:hypothetical protein
MGFGLPGGYDTYPRPSQGIGNEQQPIFDHAEQGKVFLGIIVASIDPLDRKRIPKRCAGNLERNAVVGLATGKRLKMTNGVRCRPVFAFGRVNSKYRGQRRYARDGEPVDDDQHESATRWCTGSVVQNRKYSPKFLGNFPCRGVNIPKSLTTGRVACMVSDIINSVPGQHAYTDRGEYQRKAKSERRCRYAH